jgi:hypothetical protein
MRVRFVLGSVLVGLLASVSMASGQVAAQSAAGAAPDLAASIVGKNPSQLHMRLKNISSRACQVATTAQGTIAITNVIQAGKQLSAVPLDTASDDDLGYLMQKQLTTISPGQSTDIPLLIYKVKDTNVLRTTTWSNDAGSLGSQYVIQSDKPLKLDLSYNLPITPEKGAPACGSVFATTVDDGNTIGRALVIAAKAIVCIVAVALLLWWLGKRKHKAPVVAAVILLGIGIVAIHQAPRAHADISVPPSAQAAFDTCMGVLNANRDITGPILDVINDPANHIIIVPISGTGSDMTGYDHTFTIYWNQDDHHPYAGTGGNADPCTTLFHEMYHAYDMSRGTFSRTNCAGSGIETKEVMATRAQNTLRVRLGLPARSHYGERALPSGDCSAPPPAPQCSGLHCASTNGDPHLRTFDGLLYDFQAAGEFTAARDQTGGYTIQVRQQPLSGSRYVAINTAIAFKINGDTVEIRAGQPMVLLVNGKKQTLADKTLSKGGQVNIDQEGTVILTWKDGSKAFVRSVGNYGLALSAQLSDDLAGKVDGLLGNADGEPKNDLHLRNSTKTVQEIHKDLYPKFADSWRITDTASLFTYTGGMSTANYTDHTFPDPLPALTSLPNYASALAFCKSFGISDPTILANCALDVALTGRPEFARSAATAQAFTASTQYGGTTWNASIKNPGDKVDETFDAKAGDKVFVQIPQSTLASECGVASLLAPDGSVVASGCIINGSGYIDGTTLPADGQYTVRLAPQESVGTATLRLLRIADKQGAITPDGATLKVSIDKPGIVGRYTFNGVAGQHVYLDVPNSTLTNECGILQLVAPDGSVVASGCVINGAGDIDTATLPASGQYTIVVDPNDTVTGTSKLRLVVATATSQPITVNGATLTTNLVKPGSIAQFTFNGVAGQKIYVDLPHSDFPSECGILTLRQPDGDVLSSGCIINHVGNLSDDAATLPATGQYTIILDPGGNSTGKTTIRVRNH